MTQSSREQATQGVPAPLHGIRVVDFTSIVAGPWCTRLLADCGAEVIKVEPVGDVDLMRLAPPLAGDVGRTFAQFNRGKHCISIDLKTDEGVRIARRLMDRADVVVENFRPGVMARLGLSYETARLTNPRLVYCAISGFGQQGPMADEAAYAPVVHALSGFDLAMTRAQGDLDTPLRSGVMIGDIVAGAYAFAAIQAALIRRDRYGAGAFVDTTLMESMMSLLAVQFQEAQADPPHESVVFKPTAAADGYVMIPLVSYRNYRALFPVIGRPEWQDDDRFSSFAALRENRQAVADALAAWAAKHSAEECRRHLRAAGVPCAIYQTPRDVLDNAHLRERGSFGELEDDGGRYFVLNPPFQLDGTPCQAHPMVGRPGEHSEAILADIGYGAVEIEQLRALGAFA
jgi:CoA:oxalate CoA-transferase